MEKTLKVEGMHCDACKKLISMEIDDLGLAGKVIDVTVSEEQNQGLVSLRDVEQSDVEKIIAAINTLGQYKVIE